MMLCSLRPEGSLAAGRGPAYAQRTGSTVPRRERSYRFLLEFDMATDTASAKPPTPDSPTPEPAEPPHPAIRLWRSIRAILILVLVLTAFRSSIADWNDGPTGSTKQSGV